MKINENNLKIFFCGILNKKNAQSFDSISLLAILPAIYMYALCAVCIRVGIEIKSLDISMNDIYMNISY